MKKKITERVLVLVLTIAVLLSSTGVCAVFAETYSTSVSSATASSSSSAASSAENERNTTTSASANTTAPNVVTEGGTVKNDKIEGSGTESDPYRIYDANDLLKMQDIINNTRLKNKSFVLKGDIDLSNVSYALLKSNAVLPGTIVSADKAKSDAVPNAVCFTLNGAGHKIFGLNVANTGSAAVGIFGYISANSVIKNVSFEDITVSVKYKNAVSNGAIAVYNNGLIEKCTAKNVKINVSSEANGDVHSKRVGRALTITEATGFVAINSGKISEFFADNASVSVQADKENIGVIAGLNSGTVSAAKATCITIKANGGSAIGTAAGKNSGSVEFVTADGISANVGSGSAFGGIVGVNSGAVVSCAASGKAFGSAYTGGIVGKAVSSDKNSVTSNVKNCASFVRVDANASSGAVVAAGNTKHSTNTWSSETSGRVMAYVDGSKDGDLVRDMRFAVIKVGEKKEISKEALGGSFYGGTYVVDTTKPMTFEGEGISFSETNDSVIISADSADKTGKITFTARIAPHAGYLKKAVFSKTFTVTVLTVPKAAKGDGLSEETALEISNGTELRMIQSVPYAHYKLSKNITMPESWNSSFTFTGSLDGSGYTIKAAKPFCSAISGKITNLKVELCGKITTAMFGRAVDAQFTNVKLINGTAKDSKSFVGLYAQKNSTGAFFNTVSGATKLSECFTNVPVYISDNKIKSIGGFIGLLQNAKAQINSCGASVSITNSNGGKVAQCAAFIGCMDDNKGGKIADCYATLYSDITNYAFVGGGNGGLKIENSYFGSSNKNAAAAPAKFTNVKVSEWMFKSGEQGFITGKGNNVAIALPSNIIKNAAASDFKVMYDSAVLKVNTKGITVKNGVAYVPVDIISKNTTVKNSALVLVHKGTGLRAEIKISNGLQKDKDGNYVINSGYDLAFIADSFKTLNDKSFVIANDLDMSDISFKVIGGAANAFSGKVDGKGHTISGLKVSSKAKAAMFGALNGAEIKNIKFENAVVKSNGSYAGVLAAQITGKSTVKSVSFKNCAVSAKENYAGILAGNVKDSKISDIEITDCSVSALNNAGVLAGEAVSSKISDVEAKNVKASGENNIGLIGEAEKAEIKSVAVDKAQLKAKKNVGGVIGSAEDVKLSKAQVSDSKINAEADAMGAAPAAGGVAGEFSGKLSGAQVKSSEIKAEGSAAAAGGITAVSENAVITSSAAKDGVTVNAPVAGGVVGEATGKTTIKDSKSCADVAGEEIATKVVEGAGGIIGRVTADDLGTVKLDNVNSAGTVKAADYVGGIIGSVLSQKVSGESITNCVSAAEVDVLEADGIETSGHVIGSAPELKEKDVEKAVSGVVYSSYSSDVDAYGEFEAASTYLDLDKSVKSSLSRVITDGDEVAVKVSNADAKKLGFVFDEADGWQSESEKRITVVDSTENSVKLKAEKTGVVEIVGTYQLDGDEDIELKVGFDAESDITAVLNGEGTKEAPYLISTASDLEAISQYADKNAYFELTQDITIAPEEFEFGGEFYNEGKGFTPIGSAEVPFNGTFSGNGHTISGLVINNVENGALFGYVSDAEISSLTLDNASVTAQSVAAGIAANAENSKISDVAVKNSTFTAVSEQGNAAAVAAYANKSEINGAVVDNTAISACNAETALNVACAGAVCARAVDSSISGAQLSETVTVTSDGEAGGIAGYCDNVKISNASTFAAVDGCIASAVAANVKGALEISEIVAGGSVSGTEYAAGIAAKAYDIIKADGVVLSAAISGEGEKALLAAYADEEIYTDSEDCEADFSGIVYSSYQNDIAPFASEKINAYQNAGYIDEMTDINSVSVKGGEFIFAGKDKVSVFEKIDSEFDLSSLECSAVFSNPEGLVSYDAADGTIAALQTSKDGAKLVIKFSNGLEAALPLVSVKDATGEGTKVSPFIISSEDTLGLLSVYPDAVFRMANDVALTKEWTPVENFTGTLDGAGFEISGLNVKADNAGLFAALTGDAVVRNLTFSNASVEGKASAGVVAASVSDNAKISNVNVVSSSVKADDYAGAVVGAIRSADSRLSFCKVTGCTVSANDAAGIAALVTGKSSIVSCTVDATEIKGNDAAGGVVAVASADDLSINSCETSADVSADNAGGIVGITEKAIKIISCIANGTVNGKTAEGGIIGVADGSVKVKDSKALAVLSGLAKNAAALVAKFVTRPEDNEEFASSFSGNTVNGDYDEFEPAIMKYQNVASADKEEKEIALEGSGTKEDPYIIASAADLAKIPDSSTAYFSLKNDIVLTDKDYGISIDKNGATVYGVFSDGYKPIKNFAGVFDGNGHVIKGLYIDSASDYVGLFANITANGAVKNLHVELLDGGIKGNDYVGGIAGYCDSVNGIENCSVVGASVNGRRAVGGVVGGLASSKLIKSFAMTEINAQNNAGGLAGITSGTSVIDNCFAACEVNAAGGTIIGTNNGTLTLRDVMVNGNSHGTDAIAIAVNNGTVKAERVLIAGGNDDNKTAVLNADDAKYVYEDKTTLRVSDDNITSLTTSELTSSKPEGLDSWAQSAGRYPVPVMADSYSNKMAAKAAAPSEEAPYEESTGNLKVNYKLVNNSGDKAMDSELAGVLIKSNVNGKTITSDFFTSSSKPVSLNKILVTTGGFYVDSSLPKGYEFKVTAKDSIGRTINVSDAGSMGAYVECGNADEVNLVISIVKTEIPWGVYSLWESLAR